MKITLSFQFYDLPLQHPFTISRYTVNIQKTVIVCISDSVHSGYGEATANPYYHSTQERLTASLLKVKPIVDSSAELHPTELWKKLSSMIPEDYFALCAVDIAYWDFYARKNGKTLRSYWSNESDKTPLTSYTIAIDSLEMMQQKIIEKPWPIYKIKLGMPDDIEVVKQLRKITDAVFRIDANCAWTAQQTIDNAEVLKDMNVEFLEQPLKAEDTEGMKHVKKHSVLPVIADESCQREADVENCAGIFHGINIKLMKCGGITPALRMIEKARSKGLLLMAGCMTESTVGISGLCQIASLLDYLDADGALLLSADIAYGVHFDYGKIHYAKAAGTGVKMHSK
ncbi:dipeptide epimerase [Flavobacterium sp.]|uniref:dipeptide epimerase n=1 Tax=Flavobacterium sp. TaxID=239 RepID=UPI002634DCB3|nr:dipeptide epimerase [Flavobacterium sp.]